jgi:hypothetical protein
MDEHLVLKEIQRVESILLDKSNWLNMELTRDWARTFSKSSGVYMLFENKQLVYIGESGSITGRVMDMLNSRHHTVRRAIGEKRFAHVNGFAKATSSIKFPPHIEELVQSLLLTFKISALPISFGRKEFEEYIQAKYSPELNRKGKRGVKSLI